MKWLILTVLLICFPADVFAKDIQPTISFSFPEEEISRVNHFELHWIPVEGSGIIEYLFTLEDPMEREWTTPVFDMPAGSRRAFYVVSMFSDGGQGWSNPYEFVFTGKPVILTIQRGEG